MNLRKTVIAFIIAIAIASGLTMLWQPQRGPVDNATALQIQKQAVYRQLAQETGTTPGLAEPALGMGTTGATNSSAP
jgi:uncharacterized membrane protein YccC